MLKKLIQVGIAIWLIAAITGGAISWAYDIAAAKHVAAVRAEPTPYVVHDNKVRKF